MGNSIGSFERHCGLAICIALVVCCCTAPLIGAQDQSGSVITAISLERGCFGCPGAVLALRRDGTATYTVTGNARQGTEDRTSSGKVPLEDFEKLARYVVAQGFFDMQDQYDDPKTRDGPWTTISVARAGRDKQVFRRENAGPATLAAVETAIDALKARIDFVPKLR
jgi:hypothetical protein